MYVYSRDNIYMCYSLFDALFSKTFLSHPPFKYPRPAPVAAKIYVVA